MTYHRYFNQDAIAAALKPFGFESIEEVNRFHSVDQLYRHLRQLAEASGAAEPDQTPFKGLPRRFRQAKYEAMKIENLARESVSVDDPAARMLRYYRPKLDLPQVGGETFSTNTQYVAPTSLQSTQSPAAYLKYIYELALSEITASAPAFALDARRPDLAGFALSEDNLKLEVTTLSLVNELLIAQLIAHGVADDRDALFQAFKVTRYPFALPFQLENATVRDALDAMSGLSLNVIADRGRQNAYALHQAGYSLVPNTADPLRLYADHVALLAETPDDATLYGTWYGLADPAVGNDELQHADAYCAATGLSFEEFRKLIRDDVKVYDEAGKYYANMYARFLVAGWYVKLVEDADSTYRTEGLPPEAGEVNPPEPEGNYQPLPAEAHEIENKCIRLQRRTGLAFYQLDWLLMTALYVHPSYSIDGENIHDQVLGDGTALNVLAHHVEWSKKYDLTVDQFTALLADINCYHRSGTEETTLMRQLFGTGAPQVALATRRYEPINPVTVGEVDSQGNDLGDILRAGFKLSRSDWNAILAEVSDGPSDMLDSLMMGRIYRLATLFRLFKWSILEGIALIRKVDAALLTSLAKSNLCADVLRALDQASWLADWMTKAELTAVEVVTMLTDPTEAQLYYPNQDILNWVMELQQALAVALVTESDFVPYTQWLGNDGSTVTITEAEWIADLESKGVIDSTGLVLPSDRDPIKDTIETILTENNVNLSSIQTQESVGELADRLMNKQSEQNKILANQIVKDNDPLSATAVPALLRWMSVTAFDAMVTFMSWDTALDPVNAAGFQLFFDLYRHLGVITKLNMQEPVIGLVADHPVWLAVDMVRPLSLPQIYLLTRFEWLQNAKVSANDWLAYLTKVNGEIADNGGTPPADQSENHQMLARLLDWPAEEIAQLAIGPEIGIANGCIATIQQADYLYRRITLCQDAAIGARELIDIESANGETPDWPAASASAMVGLKRFEDGVYEANARGQLDEEARDALVGCYMTQVVPLDPALEATIRSDNDLYEYLLLDVRVSSEVPTTRMLENTGSVQLYINRMLENVEPATFVDRDALRATWETAQQYRVWEANEKLALYPSNYIEPELRQGKSEIFKKFEQDLSQGDMNADTVEVAIYGYVTGLQQLSELRAHGFFFTRNMDTTTYYFTARASWEKHGYYYRNLEIDRLRLEDGSPFAMNWGDWKKASLPIAAEQVYGVVPAYAWNRLFLFWFELDEVTETKSDNSTVKHFYLRPKYSRQNLDGSFTDPWSPVLADGVDLEVTALIETAPDAYNPLIYQPYYEPEGDMIVLYFCKDEDRQDAFNWTLAGGSSAKNRIGIEGPLLGEPVSLYSDYSSIPSSFSAVVSGGYSVDPMQQTGSFNSTYSNASLSITNYVWEISPGPDVLNYRWSAQSGYFDGASQAGGVFISLSGVKIIIKVNGVEVTRNTVNGGAPYHHDGPIPLSSIDGAAQLDPERPDDGAIELIIEGIYLIYYDYSGESDNIYKTKVNHSYYYGSKEAYVSHLFYGRQDVEREAERYLLSEDKSIGTIAVSLFSTGMNDITSKVFPGYDIYNLFALDNQQPMEKGVDNFLVQVESSTDPSYGTVEEPRPDTRLDFNGPYGLYAWELFYHIPSMLAAKYSQAGKYDEALSWLQVIYDPQAPPEEQWQVWPLVQQDGAFTYSINDPDEIATEQPVQYQLATLRHYLRTMIEKGDSYYRQETTETLRLAKMYYVAAEGLFLREAGEDLERSTRDDWKAPALGAVEAADFRPPYNQEMVDNYSTLQRRLYNLRHWRTIDGEPLNIPLIAAPIDPRQLQMAALSGVPATQASTLSQTTLPYTFDTALAKATAAVKNLMYFGDLLTRGLYQRDQQAYEELKAKLASYVVENFEVGGQVSLIDSLYMELEILKKEQQETQKYQEFYTRFANELVNSYEEGAYAMLGLKTAMQSAAMAQAMISGGLKLIPTVFGFSVGGADPEGPAEAGAVVSECLAANYETTAEIYFHRGEVQRRQQESQMEQQANALALERIQLSIERLEFDIGEEEGTLEVLKEKSRLTQDLVEFQARRSTNADFWNWYVGRITSLYDSAYDTTVRFCRLAERAYQSEVGDPTAKFVNPVWDAKYHGLLSGQSLMLDLQRMDFAYMERYQPPLDGQTQIALSSYNPDGLEVLKRGGRVLFTLDEALFDKGFPDEFDRRIKSIRVRLAGVEDKDTVNGRLSLIGHRVHFERKKAKDNSVFNVFGRQQISLLKAETDTAGMTARNGRFRPFERCGVESTWMLSFPAAVKAIEAKQKNFEQMALLEKLKDVIIEISYTARV